MQGLIQGLRFGWRILAKDPGFTLVATFTLALGIGANTIVFSVVNALLFRPLPVKNPHSLYAVVFHDQQTDYSDQRIPLPVIRDYLEQDSSFAQLAAYAPIHASLKMNGRSSSVWAQLVTSDYFSTLGVEAAVGRLFLPEENEVALRNPVVVISYDCWRRKFNSDPQIVGTNVEFGQDSEGNETFYEIVGVAVPGFKGLEPVSGTVVDFWVPSMMEEWIRPWQPVSFRLFGRLHPEMSLNQATANLNFTTQSIVDKYQGVPLPNYERMGPLKEDLRVRLNYAARGSWGAYQSPSVVWRNALLFAAAIGAVLLITCANIAGLLLVRSVKRRKEIAIRLSLGATRGQILRQLLVENLILALFGGALGLLAAQWGRDALLLWQPFSLPADLNLDLDWRVAAFTTGLSLSTVLLFGLVPALQAVRFELQPALKAESTSLAGSEHRLPIQNVFVAIQVALSMLLLVCAGLFLRSFVNLRTADLGFNAKNLIFARIDTRDSGLDGQSAGRLFQQIVSHVGSVPGVRSVSVCQFRPWSGSSWREFTMVLGREPREDEPKMLQVDTVGPNYFETMGIPVLREGQSGRLGPNLDRIVVNERFSEMYFPGEDPVGQETSWGAIGALVKDSKMSGLRERPEPLVYEQVPIVESTFCHVLVQTEGEPEPLLSTIAGQIRGMLGELDTLQVQTMEEIRSESLETERAILVMVHAFGAIALLLTSVGIYGTVSYSVTRQSRDIGIRMALGAQAADVRKLVMKHGTILAMAGLLVGLLATFGLTRFLSSQLFEVSETDPLTYAGVASLLLAVVLVATYIPARRATKIDPLVALRHE